MKLYVAPGACSLSPHIVLREAGIPFELDFIKFGPVKKTSTGEDFTTVSPKGQVPCLRLDDGQILTEGAVMVQFIADKNPETTLLPKAGTFERVRVQEWLNYVATELHKGFSPLFRPTTPEESKVLAKAALAKQFDFLSKSLADKTFLTGTTFTVADAYLFTILQWTKGKPELDLAKWPVLQSYVGRIAERPAVRAALEAESAGGSK